MDALSQLFYLHGIGFEFTKYTGEQVFFSEETRKRALQCCGVDTNNEAGIAQLTYDLDASLWLALVPSVSLVEQSTCLLKLRIDERQQYLAANIDVPSLGMHLAFDNLYNLAVTGEYYLHGVRYIELALPIGNMPIGYHDANVQVGEQHAITQIWCVPEQVYQVGDTKRTGLSIQLYTLKNRANFGIGDFDDLLALTKL